MISTTSSSLLRLVLLRLRIAVGLTKHSTPQVRPSSTRSIEGLHCPGCQPQRIPAGKDRHRCGSIDPTPFRLRRSERAAVAARLERQHPWRLRATGRDGRRGGGQGSAFGGSCEASSPRRSGRRRCAPPTPERRRVQSTRSSNSAAPPAAAGPAAGPAVVLPGRVAEVVGRRRGRGGRRVRPGRSAASGSAAGGGRRFVRVARGSEGGRFAG